MPIFVSYYSDIYTRLGGKIIKWLGNQTVCFLLVTVQIIVTPQRRFWEGPKTRKKSGACKFYTQSVLLGYYLTITSWFCLIHSLNFIAWIYFIIYMRKFERVSQFKWYLCKCNDMEVEFFFFWYVYGSWIIELILLKICFNSQM